jgi:hypothetical protein
MNPDESFGQFGASSGKTSISFTTKSASVPEVATCSTGAMGPAMVMSSASGSVWKTSTSGRRDANRWSAVM